jgi:hypothetical protein
MLPATAIAPRRFAWRRFGFVVIFLFPLSVLFVPLARRPCRRSHGSFG